MLTNLEVGHGMLIGHALAQLLCQALDNKVGILDIKICCMAAMVFGLLIHEFILRLWKAHIVAVHWSHLSAKFWCFWGFV